MEKLKGSRGASAYLGAAAQRRNDWAESGLGEWGGSEPFEA